MRPFPRLLAAATTAMLLLAACSDSSSGDGDGTAFPAAGATIAIQGWPAGTTGTVRLHRGSYVADPLAVADVDATGRFTYALGVPDAVMAFGEQEGVTVSPPDAQYQVVVLAATLLDGDASPTGELRIGTRYPYPQPVAGDTIAELFYVDRDVTVTGAADGCTFDLALHAGWNY
ncbi:MAG TPA: hypothetical protein VD838_17765, partial [Anaeromyxobacteraceae bacterium]|nr:hypothetical protein [Anaeromyxobacteraceae bacterium]